MDVLALKSQFLNIGRLERLPQPIDLLQCVFCYGYLLSLRRKLSLQDLQSRSHLFCIEFDPV
jgi:hypothetical protein